MQFIKKKTYRVNIMKNRPVKNPRAMKMTRGFFIDSD